MLSYKIDDCNIEECIYREYGNVRGRRFITYCTVKTMDLFPNCPERVMYVIHSARKTKRSIYALEILKTCMAPKR